MLSILIPIYNYDVTKLVQKLTVQCQKARIAYEIICFDDLSKEKYKLKNQPILNLFRVNYVELSQNMGRSKIRNKLSEVARYPYLLFIDCDSKIKYANYIKNYITCIKEGNDIIYGGRVYNKTKPRSKSKILHWKYGIKREALPVKKRIRNPYLSFQTNNFVISNDIFSQIRFDNDIEGYGYEDLVFATEIKKLNFKIKHIHNPVQHLDIQKLDDFLKKTKKATENLKILDAENKIIPTRLSKYAQLIIKMGLEQQFIKYYKKYEIKIDRELSSTDPNLYYLDIYKLFLFLKPI